MNKDLRSKDKDNYKDFVNWSSGTRTLLEDYNSALNISDVVLGLEG